jgi:hypothetical protein
MKTLIIFLMLVSVSSADMVILSKGQSNSGCCGVGSELTEEQRTLPANVEYWKNGHRMLSIANISSFGPEISLMHLLAEAYPDEHIVVIRKSVPGSAISRWLPGGDIYPVLISDIKRIIGDRNIPIKALFWTQGEQDTKLLDTAMVYQDNLMAFYTQIQADLGQDFPIIYGIVSSPISYGAYPDIVQQKQIDMGKLPGFYPVTEFGLTKQAAGLHMDTQGQLGLGMRYFRAFLASQ